MSIKCAKPLQQHFLAFVFCYNSVTTSVFQTFLLTCCGDLCYMTLMGRYKNIYSPQTRHQQTKERCFWVQADEWGVYWGYLQECGNSEVASASGRSLCAAEGRTGTLQACLQSSQGKGPTTELSSKGLREIITHTQYQNDRSTAQPKGHSKISEDSLC